MMYKHGKGKLPTGWVILVIAILVYAFNIGGIKTTVDGLIGGAAPAAVRPYAPRPAEIPCFIEDTTISLDSYDAFSKGTEPTGTVNSYHRMWINDVDQGWKSEGAEVTASPGDTVTVWFGGNSTGFDTGGAAYYSKVVEQEVPCAGTLKLQAGLYAQDTSVTFTIKTDDGQVNSETNKQTMGTDGQYDLPIRLKTSSKQAYGNPTTGKDNIVCIAYNTSQADEIKIDGAVAAFTPNALQTLQFAGLGSASETTHDCWYIPTLKNDPNVADDEYWDGSLIVDTGTNWDASFNDTNMVYIIDTGIDLDATTLEFIYGVQDETKNDLGDRATQNTTIHVD